MTTLAAIVLIAAACGGSSDDGENTEVGAETTAAAASDADAASGGGGEGGDAAEDGDSETASDTDGSADDGDSESETVEITEDMSADEIAELLFPAFDENSIQDQQAQWEDEERQRQQIIVECMTAQGFEYVPVDYGDAAFFGGSDDELDPTSREWAETYGFGYTTFTFDEDDAADEADAWVDPNQAYVEGLSDSARDAYFEALYGAPPEFDPNMTDEEFEQLYAENPELFEPQGCEGEAYRETNDFAELDAVFFALSNEFDELYERVEADPRIAAFQQEWAECMAGKGHAYRDMEDMYDALGERANELWTVDDYVDPFEGLSEEEIEAIIDNSTDEELDALFAGPEPDPELLAETQEWEIALALDSFDCGGTSQWDEWEEIFSEYQQIFIEENLDAIQAALAGNG
jgi:hypothetical protein